MAEDLPPPEAPAGLSRSMGELARVLVTSPAIPHIIAAVALGALAVVSGLLWMEMKRRFPIIEPGSYVGSVEGLAQGAVGRLYLERRPGEDDLLVVLMQPGWHPQRVPAVVAGEQGSEARAYLPISVGGPDGRLQLIGSRVGPDEYAGVVQNLDTGVEGQWSVAALLPDNTELSPGDAQELRLWLSLKSELDETNKRIGDAEERVPAQKREIERLTRFITEKDRLRATAEEKFGEVKEELRVAQGKLKTRQEEARRLEGQVELAQRVTPMGKLVSLSRESLEREGRWVQAVLRTSATGLTPELLAAVAKGERIVKLKREIAREERRIAELSAPRPTAGEGEAPSGNEDREGE